MWELTIRQKKEHKEWNSKDEVTYTSDDHGELLDMAEYLINHGTPASETSYELKEVKSRFIDPTEEKEEQQ